MTQLKTSPSQVKEMQLVYSLTNRLYFGNFAVYKRTISVDFEHPLLKKTVCHKFHIAHLEQYEDVIKFKKRLKDFGNTIDKADPTEEMHLLGLEPKEGLVYFFFETWDGKKRLPLYYSSMYTRDCYGQDFSTLDSNNMRPLKWSNYIKACKEEISGYIYERTFHPSCMYDLLYFFHDFGFAIYERFDKENPEREDESIDPSWLNNCKRTFGQYKEPAMRNYALAVLDSVFKQAFHDKEVMQCQFCGRYIDYVKNKLFCSLGYEKRDCAKRARNKRYYAKRGHQRLDVYRNSTKELRVFYKEKNIQK